MVHLANMQQLRSLELSGTRVSDAGVQHLTALQGLEDLQLSGSEITDVGLAAVAELPNLTSLTLFGTGASDAGLAHLKKLSRLQRLVLHRTPLVSLAGVEDLQKALPQCEISYEPALAERPDRAKRIRGARVPGGAAKPAPDASRGTNAADSAKISSGPTDKPFPPVVQPQPRPLSPAADCDRARNELTALGVSLSKNPEDRELTNFSLVGQRLTADIVSRLSRFSSLVEADLQDSDSTDVDLPLLLQLPKIRTLRLNGSQFTQASLQTLSELPDLHEVYLAGTAVSVEAIERLATLPNITLVGFRGMQVPEECLAVLGKFPNLESVAIMPDSSGLGGSTAPLITDSGLALLVEIPTLKSIVLGRGSQISDAGLQYVQKLPKLEKLSVQCGLSDAGLAHLRELDSSTGANSGVIDSPPRHEAARPAYHRHRSAKPE